MLGEPDLVHGRCFLGLKTYALPQRLKYIE